LQIFIKSSTDENREGYNPHRAIPRQRHVMEDFAAAIIQSLDRAVGHGARKNSHMMLKISAHLLDGSSGSQREKSIPQQVQGNAVGTAMVEFGRAEAGEMVRLRIWRRAINHSGQPIQQRH
jgi:hypothetical protein